jgi:serine/threonine protein kinase
MKKIDHPNIIKLYEVIDDPASDKLYLVMPVADYGECLTWSEDKCCYMPNHKLLSKNNTKVMKQATQTVEFYSEDFLKKMAKSLLNALDYLHTDLNIVHRDIKPANILMDETGSPLLVDFGKARQLKTEDEDQTTSIQGTYTFLPPECCSFETDIYSMKKADIWALGMTLYCLTFNRFPFTLGNTEIQLMENICQHELKFEGREISNELKLFLQ